MPTSRALQHDGRMQMTSTPVDTTPHSMHARFRMGFIWAALAIAIGIGFAIGAHLSFVIGFELQLGAGFYSFIQAHGHAQLVGWTGLFIIGISLHFIPRLAGAPLLHQHRPGVILWLVAGGILLRSIGHCHLPYVVSTPAFVPLLWIVAVAGVMELLGIVLYLLTILDVLRRSGDAAQRPALVAVQPYFFMMFMGWLLYALLQAILVVHMASSRLVAVDQAWDEFAIQVFTGLILLPVAFAFSVRTFPLYLRLPAPQWPVRGAAIAYVLFLAVQILPTLPAIMRTHAEIAIRVSSIGAMLKGAFILWFVWKLDVLTRRRQPWTVNRVLQPQPDRRRTRPGLPDYGEFGSFERLLYSSYAWLIVAAGFEVITGASVILGFAFPQSSDAARHVVLLGFISLLIFGMAVRMIPGFLGKNKIASARLVGATFWLGNAAVVCRVVPIMAPASLLENLPSFTPISQIAFALSGILGMAAVGCLAINLRKTSKLGARTV